jgi:hypothetical protein
MIRRVSASASMGRLIEGYEPSPLLLARFMVRSPNNNLERANRAFVALKQFLLVSAQQKSLHSCSPSQPIDEMWHEFLMFTEEYQGFCLDWLGTMVHHHPISPASDPAITEDTYRLTRKAAQKMFGTLDPEFWPKPKRRASAHTAGGCGSLCR